MVYSRAIAITGSNGFGLTLQQMETGSRKGYHLGSMVLVVSCVVVAPVKSTLEEDEERG
jgi:hypothetical protein